MKAMTQQSFLPPLLEHILEMEDRYLQQTRQRIRIMFTL